MIEIQRAEKGENLDNDWKNANEAHFGKAVQWEVEKFRFKAVKNGEIIGKITGKFEAGTVFVNSLIVKKGFRGKGVGSQLIQKAENFGQKKQAHKIWLLTGKTWKENSFYKKQGFKLASELRDFYLHSDFVIYTKDI
ncbi:GNAT family N-acetyltransferase [Candidatus Dojkabacteria bacterium]|nr:GNAT family N-acetyltransferase [Candidatus Dojkabacteria bacterium]